MKIKALIVEDEIKSRQNLQMMLEEFCKDVDIVGCAGNINEAMERIHELEPELLFLDVELSGRLGFDLLSAFKKRNFDVIFTTAYDEYALKALKEQAIDYILKPIDRKELILAVEKTLEKRLASDTLPVLKQLLKQNSKKGLINTRLQIPFDNGIQFIEISNIIRCESHNNYSEIFLKNGKKTLCTLTLSEVEHKLENASFARVHQSHLVNLDYIVKYHRTDGGILELSDGTRIPVSRRKKDDLIKLFKGEEVFGPGI